MLELLFPAFSSNKQNTTRMTGNELKKHLKQELDEEKMSRAKKNKSILLKSQNTMTSNQNNKSQMRKRMLLAQGVEWLAQMASLNAKWERELATLQQQQHQQQHEQHEQEEESCFACMRTIPELDEPQQQQQQQQEEEEQRLARERVSEQKKLVEEIIEQHKKMQERKRESEAKQQQQQQQQASTIQLLDEQQKQQKSARKQKTTKIVDEEEENNSEETTTKQSKSSKTKRQQMNIPLLFIIYMIVVMYRFSFMPVYLELCFFGAILSEYLRVYHNQLLNRRFNLRKFFPSSSTIINKKISK